MIGGRILKGAGRVIFGRIRERVQDRIEERFDEDPSDALAGPPEPVKVWEPPGWLRLIVKLLNALLDGLSGGKR